MHTPKKTNRVFLGLLSILLLWAQVSLAAEVSHVSNITEGLTSPTSLKVTGDGIAVLEPFAKQVVLFTPDGIVTSRVNISGEARALSLLTGRTYIFCEREAGEISRINLDTGLQDVFLANVGDPVDLIVDSGTCRILDANQGRVLVCDLNGQITNTVVLAIPNDEAGTWLADLAWDQTRSRYYAWDQTNSRVLAFAENGDFQGSFCSFGSDKGAVTRGGEIVCDTAGWIFVTDRYQGQIAVFDEAWNFVINIQPIDLGLGRMVSPTGLAVDVTGLVYVACTEGPAIEVFHLDKAPAPLEIPRASAVSPADGDTLSGSALRLVIGVQAPAESAASLTTEFQVFASPDTTALVAEVSGLQLTESVVAGAMVVGTVGWTLPGVLDTGESYRWRARATADGRTGNWSVLRSFTKGVAPAVFCLEQNVPNPFNPLTVISFVLTGAGNAQLGVFDIRGHMVWNKDLSGLAAGRHDISWTGTDNSGNRLASGVYFYRLVETNRSDTRKMVLMK